MKGVLDLLRRTTPHQAGDESSDSVLFTSAFAD